MQRWGGSTSQQKYIRKKARPISGVCTLARVDDARLRRWAGTRGSILKSVTKYSWLVLAPSLPLTPRRKGFDRIGSFYTCNCFRRWNGRSSVLHRFPPLASRRRGYGLTLPNGKKKETSLFCSRLHAAKQKMTRTDLLYRAPLLDFISDRFVWQPPTGSLEDGHWQDGGGYTEPNTRVGTTIVQEEAFRCGKCQEKQTFRNSWTR